MMIGDSTFFVVGLFMFMSLFLFVCVLMFFFASKAIGWWGGLC